MPATAALLFCRSLLMHLPPPPRRPPALLCCPRQLPVLLLTTAAFFSCLSSSATPPHWHARSAPRRTAPLPPAPPGRPPAQATGGTRGEISRARRVGGAVWRGALPGGGVRHGACTQHPRRLSLSLSRPPLRARTRAIKSFFSSTPAILHRWMECLRGSEASAAWRGTRRRARPRRSGGRPARACVASRARPRRRTRSRRWRPGQPVALADGRREHHGDGHHATPQQ